MAQVSQQMFLGNVPVFGFQNESLVAINLFDKFDIVQNGLQLWLDAGNTASYPGSGTTWTDLSGNSYNATLVNTPTFSSTNGGEFDFNGTDEYATIYTLPGTLFTSNWTMQFWVKWDNIISDKCLFSQGTATNNSGLHLITRSSGVTGNQPRYVFAMFNNDESTTTLATTSSYVFLTFIYNSSTYEKQVYINDTLSTAYASVENQYLATNSNAEIGRLGWSGTNINYFDGQLAQIYMYNRILTSDEINQNYNNGKGRYGL
jgi:hypothetical protein